MKPFIPRICLCLFGEMTPLIFRGNSATPVVGVGDNDFFRLFFPFTRYSPSPIFHLVFQHFLWLLPRWSFFFFWWWGDFPFFWRRIQQQQLLPWISQFGGVFFGVTAAWISFSFSFFSLVNVRESERWNNGNCASSSFLRGGFFPGLTVNDAD